MDNEITLIDKLPVEVLSHIFTFLKLPDKKIASTVCRSWYDASIDPKLIHNEVIQTKHLDDDGFHQMLKVFAKSQRAFLKFRIFGFGTSNEGSDDEDSEDDNNDISFSIIDINAFTNVTTGLIDKDHWVKTTWPLLAAKVVSLEFFGTITFSNGILPALLNETLQLKVLTIQNDQYCTEPLLNEIKRLDCLEELTIEKFLTDHIQKNKLLGVIPKQLKKLCLKSMWGCHQVNEDIVNALNHCSLYIKSLELINIVVTPELMQSISSIDMKLEKFSLLLAKNGYYKHEPEILAPLFKTKWPLVDLTLVADCVNEDILRIVIDTFKNLKNLSVPIKSQICNGTKCKLHFNGSLVGSITRSMMLG